MEERGETGPHGDGQKTLGKGANRWAWRPGANPGLSRFILQGLADGSLAVGELVKTRESSGSESPPRHPLCFRALDFRFLSR